MGYKLAGMEVVGAIESAEHQAKNYRLNNPGTQLYTRDIHELDPLGVMDQLRLKPRELDVLDGSPPYSSFSMSGRKKGKVTNDLFFEYVRFLHQMKPRYFVTEAAKGLATGKSKGYFNRMLKELKGCGYVVQAKVLNSKNYGVPQSRERIMFIGVRDDLAMEYEHPLWRKPINVGTAIKSVKHTKLDLDAVNVARYAIHKELMKLHFGETSKRYFNLVKQHPLKPCKTITQKASDITAASVCHWDNRKFTIPELKRIQSFPDDYRLVGTYAQMAEGIGISVPPLMMRAIATSIRDAEESQTPGRIKRTV